jgi:erythromycin esterase
LKYLKFLIFSFFISCARPESKIANSVVSLDINSTAPFEYIGKIVGDKEIVILGESQHGDGKTLEMKSRLLKYLVEEKGFNTIAFEGRGFLDMEILNSSTPLDTLSKSFKKQALTSWYATEQQDQLNKAILNNELIFIGLESYSYFVSREPDSYINYLRKFLNVNYGDIEFKFWKQLKMINYNISFSNTDSITEKDIEIYAQSLTSILDVIQNQSLNPDINKLEKEIVLNSIKNAVIYSHLFKNRWLYHNEINFSDYNNLRDEQMATNLIWHKERNPNAKIVIWTANFHGAKKIREVIYKKEDPDLYKNYTLLGEHLFCATFERSSKTILLRKM